MKATLLKMMDKVTINLNMFSTLMEDIVVGNMYSTLIVTVDRSTSALGLIIFDCHFS